MTPRAWFHRGVGTFLPISHVRAFWGFSFPRRAGTSALFQPRFSSGMLQHRVVQSCQRLQFLFFCLSRELVCVGQGQCPHLTGHGGLELTPTCPHSLLTSTPVPWPHLGGGFPALRKLGFVPCVWLKPRAGKLLDPDDGEQVGALWKVMLCYSTVQLLLLVFCISLWMSYPGSRQGFVSRGLCPGIFVHPGSACVRSLAVSSSWQPQGQGQDGPWVVTLFLGVDELLDEQLGMSRT